MITKNVNKKVEDEIRSIAKDVPKVYQTKKKKQLTQTVLPKSKKPVVSK